jgi:hypothetical protein
MWAKAMAKIGFFLSFPFFGLIPSIHFYISLAFPSPSPIVKNRRKPTVPIPRHFPIVFFPLFAPNPPVFAQFMPILNPLFPFIFPHFYYLLFRARQIPVTGKEYDGHYIPFIDPNPSSSFSLRSLTRLEDDQKIGGFI